MKLHRRFVQVLAVILFLSFALSTSPATPSVYAAAYDYQVLSGKHAVSGVQRVLVVLMEFDDMRHSQSPADIKKVAIDDLNNYYLTVSRGKVTIEGDVYGWYMASRPIAYYGKDSRHPGDDDHVQSLAKEALASIPTSVDLTPYNFLVVVHAGQDQAADQFNSISDEIWSVCFCSVFPNYGSFAPVSVQSKTFQEYAFLSEFNGIGTFAHEWGHFFGLPDLYDTATGETYVGYWSLMDAGSWCCYNEQQSTPSDIGGWGDALLGWITPSLADKSLVITSFSMNPLDSPDPTTVVIPISSRTYYFIEYRTQTGVDSELPSSGVLIYYVDERLDSGQGIVRLVDPETGKLFPPQERTRDLNVATYQNGEQFRDLASGVYVAFLGGSNYLTMLYSKQELVGTILGTNLKTISPPSSASWGDKIPINGSLVAEDGTPLSGQTIEVDYLDPRSNQWQMIGTAVTGQQGEIALDVGLTMDVGDYKFRILYPGGKAGDAWYSSSSSDFMMTVNPAAMKINVSFPKTVGPDRVIIEISAAGDSGEPLRGVVLEVYVDNVRKNLVQTDANGRATVEILFDIREMGTHIITVKAQLANHLPTENSDEILVIPPFWFLGVLIGVIAAVVALTFVRRRGASKDGTHETQGSVCPQCGTRLPHDTAFCTNCGTSIPRPSEE